MDKGTRSLWKAAAIAAVCLLQSLTPIFAANVVYDHDPQGRVTKATYPDGSYVTYSYDLNGNRTSAVVTLSTDTTAPTAPATLTATPASPTRIDLNWSPSTDNRGVTQYLIERCQGSGCSTFGQINTSVPTTYSDTSLTGSTTYVYRVRAEDAALNHSSFSPTASATTPVAPDTTPPAAPGVPTFSALTSTSATATWTAATDDRGVTGYDYRLNSGSWVAAGNVLSVSLTGLSAAVHYTFDVRAKDGAGNIGPISSGSFTTPDTTAPSAPGTPSFTSITGTSATVSWTAATDNVGVTGYEYQLNGGSWVAAGNVLSVNLTSLSSGVSYTVAVRARDGAGNIGAVSSASFSTPDSVPPTAPGTPSFSSISFNSAVASWTAATDNVGISRYEYRVNGGSWTSVGTALTASLSSLAVMTSYAVDVRAVDGAGNPGSASSNSFTTSTPTISISTVNAVAFATTSNYQLTTGGDVLAFQQPANVSTDVGDWLSPKQGMTNFSVRATKTSSLACDSGTMGAWVSIASASWSMNAPPVGSPHGSNRLCSFTLEIAASSNTSVVLGSASIQVTAVRP